MSDIGRRSFARICALGSILVAALAGCDGGAAGPALDTREAIFSLLATGDVGRTRAPSILLEGQLAVARGMTRQSRAHPVDGLVLLGDNFYWDGLERAHLVDRIRLNLALPYCAFSALAGARSSELAPTCRRASLAATATKRDPRLYAVFGNHDLRSEESVELQRDAIPDFISNWTMASAGVEVFELDPGVSLILFESELHLTEDSLADELLAALERSRGPWRIIAAHRPICMGERGARADGGFPTKIQHVIRLSAKPVHAYLSGHEHNLQLLVSERTDPSLHVIAGSGARALPLIGPEFTNRRYGKEQLGFARIDLIEARADGDADKTPTPESTLSQQRLRVSLFSTPTLPWLTWRTPRLEAQWSTGLAGDLRDELAPSP